MIRRASISGFCLIALLAGCETNSTAPRNVPQTEGERTVAQGKMIQRQGEMMSRGERLIADGRGQRERGQALRDQGKSGSAASRQVARDLGLNKSLVYQIWIGLDE